MSLASVVNRFSPRRLFSAPSLHHPFRDEVPSVCAGPCIFYYLIIRALVFTCLFFFQKVPRGFEVTPFWLSLLPVTGYFPSGYPSTLFGTCKFLPFYWFLLATESVSQCHMHVVLPVREWNSETPSLHGTVWLLCSWAEAWSSGQFCFHLIIMAEIRTRRFAACAVKPQKPLDPTWQVWFRGDSLGGGGGGSVGNHSNHVRMEISKT